ncbi:MAG: GntR family transcriptional regulator [Rubellimicrobium sp.]|nr:GntR family transcriptional regulator [Rubellimicrobium sp.]
MPPDAADAPRGGAFDGSSPEPIYRGLRLALMRGDVRPGERMVVKRLADAFGSGTLPVRHALQRLVGEGALSDEPFRGARVPIRSVDELLDLRRVRCAVEGQAAEWATGALTGADMERLHALQAAMRSVHEAGQAEHYLDWNFEFHFTLYGAAGSPLLIPLIERLWLRAGPYLNTMRTDLTLGAGLDTHDMLLDALARGDAAAARQAVEADISDATATMIRALTEDPERTTRPRRTDARRETETNAQREVSQ